MTGDGMTASMGDPSDGTDQEPPELAAMVLRTLFSGVKSGPSGSDQGPIEAVAMDWQTMGTKATFIEMHTITHGAAQGRGFELIGRVAAAGEQLGLAGTALLEAQRWLEAERKAERGADMAMRALAEMSGYYALSAGQGLINVTLRSLLLSPACAAELNHVKRYRRAAGFPPFSASPAAWLFFNQDEVDTLGAAAAAANDPSVGQWFDLLPRLIADHRWDALTARRHEDFHRWRPQSISGGVEPKNPWATEPGGASSLHFGVRGQYKPLDPASLITEAEAGLQALNATMEAWMAAWPKALKGLGCPFLKT
jgi:hypothetical protein